MVMNMKKYQLTDEIMQYNGHILRRIRALRDFGIVKAGALGGWVEHERNLSQNGNCWVFDNACVYGEACVLENAQIFDEARVHGRANISENAQVYCSAHVTDYVYIL